MADTKISALPATTTISDDDLLCIVDDPSGVPITKKITVADFINTANIPGTTVLSTVHTAVDYTILVSDQYIGVTSTAAPRVLTLPSAVTAGDGKYFIIKDESGGAQTNNITLSPVLVQTIDGDASFIIDSNYGAVGIISDGANWFIY